MKCELSVITEPLGFSLHQSGTVMKSSKTNFQPSSSFSLHQSGTVMKLPVIAQ